MKLSVVVPVFNKAPYIEECFASIFSQSFADYELIVVDDKSTDNSLEVLGKLKDDRLRVVPLERNLGPAGAAQRAMDMAQGEYILRVDADDINLPERFARQVAFMDANLNVGASGGHLELFGSETGLWKFPLGAADCRAELLFGNPVVQGASILRTQLLRDKHIRFEDHWPRIGEDWIFWSRMAAHCEFGNVDHALIMYRRGEQNSMFGQDHSVYRAVIVREVFAMLDIPLSEEQCKLHLVGLRSFQEPPTRATLIAFQNWLQELRAMNEQRGLFDKAAFERRLQRAWDQLFFALPRYGVAPALAHYRLSAVRDSDRLVYLAKYTVNRWFGRNVKR